jgi:hypothetical protein
MALERERLEAEPDFDLAERLPELPLMDGNAQQRGSVGSSWIRGSPLEQQTNCVRIGSGRKVAMIKVANFIGDEFV